MTISKVKAPRITEDQLKDFENSQILDVILKDFFEIKKSEFQQVDLFNELLFSDDVKVELHRVEDVEDFEMHVASEVPNIVNWNHEEVTFGFVEIDKQEQVAA
ncbi:hypothetical protein H9L19_06885 [Weissella diestrammenae]|uniref:Uncharacterized protein n=1 Tax=Weissella diestrammenae TaxID=1162633 RepID=A0A7G9T4R8_9LACO|nr:hypothetical protein [Weissella diestrammenae]MCM0582804.1 hypothetical protein [Weissella diestrammenae]QNN75093.1 hypothetical protein H9L19_06885 [Weissella diestrammenae]